MKSGTNKKNNRAVHHAENAMFGKELSFAAKEAYKLLRTNLKFSLPKTVLSENEKAKAHIVGITSSVSGEGKSTTVLNLAGTLAEEGKRVLVIEGDLRKPTLSKKLNAALPERKDNEEKKMGLSNMLISDAKPEAFIHTIEFNKINNVPITFDVLFSGEIPPNPSELISSKQMKERLAQLGERYRYILLDLPPVTAVADAVNATALVDGMIVVVRNDYVDNSSLRDAIRQLRQVNAKILGFVFACADSPFGGYRRKYRYRYYRYGKYSHYYGSHGYGNGYGEEGQHK